MNNQEKFQPLKPLPDTHPSRSNLPDTHPINSQPSFSTNAVHILNNTGQGEQLPASVSVEEKVYTKENPFIPPKGNEMYDLGWKNGYEDCQVYNGIGVESSPSTPEVSWKQEFRNKFAKHVQLDGAWWDWRVQEINSEIIEDFISNLLEEQQKEIIASEEAYFTGREDGRKEAVLYKHVRISIEEDIKKDLINQILSEAPEDTVEVPDVLGGYYKMIGFNRANQQWREIISKIGKTD